jgi:hypothetical protein
LAASFAATLITVNHRLKSITAAPGTGLSVRADNFHVIPLCHAHHRTGGGVAIHAGRKSWEEKFGTEGELLAQVLQELGRPPHDASSLLQRNRPICSAVAA